MPFFSLTKKEDRRKKKERKKEIPSDNTRWIFLLSVMIVDSLSKNSKIDACGRQRRPIFQKNRLHYSTETIIQENHRQCRRTNYKLAVKEDLTMWKSQDVLHGMKQEQERTSKDGWTRMFVEGSAGRRRGRKSLTSSSLRQHSSSPWIFIFTYSHIHIAFFACN